jgi:hypothetical protein
MTLTGFGLKSTRSIDRIWTEINKINELAEEKQASFETT